MSAVAHVGLQAADLTACAAGSGDTCNVYIGVHGYAALDPSVFTVVASYQGSPAAAVNLAPGVPQASEVEAGSYQYFYVNVDEPMGTTLTVSVTPISGDPDLYINTGAFGIDLAWPDKTHHHYSSVTSSGQDQVIIDPADNSGHYCNKCRLKISVYGFTRSSFRITYAAGMAMTELSDGIPQTGFVTQFNYTYYTFSADKADADLVFTLTPTSGDSDLFVIKQNPDDPSERPSREHFTWSATGLSVDQITIDHTDPNFCSGCNYLLGVFGFTRAEYSTPSWRPLIASP